MITVTKTIRFDAAHVLTNHQGLCKNLHGHTYRVDVSVAQGDGDTRDMVIDFKDLKRIASEVVCERFDHAFIYNTESAGEREIAAVVEKNGMRTVAIPFRSTAENLARMFFGELKALIPGLSAVKVWETADSCAEYRE
ncbi:MAG: 6-carboxytetrahydropterin synthase QueD [Kiritimatiellae bacterium]|jgi:6-pyruvoyltetrahydropterin/6-carboxytetrahydropterin synthase|nr:6-carboxytetrahydropterin synthase QueD [Kiritimatiellia bacterium]MBQ3748263.1 6-carboxytetrahydropterin synthase QueD [Kiritimatiellia bacterium]MBR0241721.1 6-carboxytetrahydropterin synthase QueD [Kiritimatiellia bacterium]